MNTNNTISSEFDSFLVEIRDECHIATARRAAKSLAESIGFSERLTCHITTSVSELATNLYLHTEKGGSIKISALDHKGKKESSYTLTILGQASKMLNWRCKMDSAPMAVLEADCQGLSD